MLYYSNAKINLGLNVIEKRNDGFHNIETVFYPIAVEDAMEFVPSEKLELTSSGIEVDCELEDNLIIKAYRLLKNDFDIIPILRFHIHKTIPFGAGLGGGSANAAYTLKALNQFYKLNLSEDELLKYAKQLGSDCAFFIKNTAVYAEGKGDVFTNAQVDLSNYYILLIHPGFGVSTPEAYANIKPEKPIKNCREVLENSVETWKDDLINDFEWSVFQNYPLIEDLKNKLYKKKAVYAAMSGSGSAVFGVFKEKPLVDEFNEYWTWVGKL